MTYERFSQLWDALVRDRPKSKTVDTDPIDFQMSPRTMSALIDYANGDKSKFNAIRKTLGRKKL